MRGGSPQSGLSLVLSIDLIDLKNAVIMDVEATTTIRQAEVDAAKAMLDRTAEQFDVTLPSVTPGR